MTKKNKKIDDKIRVLGTGLLALDIVLNGSKKTKPKLLAGGSFGNVITILSYLGLETYPIARLAANKTTNFILDDIKHWKVNTKLIFKEEKGSTPIIIHRILKDKQGIPRHKFEFRNPINGNWLPSFRPFLAKNIQTIENSIPKSQLFYFDRVSRSSIDLAKLAKKNGALVYFEPSSYKDSKQFHECLDISDIIKYSKDRIKNYRTLFPKTNATLEIETDGAQGVNYRFKSSKWKPLRPFYLEDIIDAAGAGDWCSAGIMKTIAGNGDLKKQTSRQIESAINFGQAQGAINCLFEGARGAMYNLKLESFIKLTEQLISKGQIDKELKINSVPKKELTYTSVERLFKTL